MIDIDFIDNRLCIILDPSHQYYTRAKIVVRSLLTAFEYAEDKWHINYEDLGFLRQKLDLLGLVDGRAITSTAMDFVNYLSNLYTENESIKKGFKNEEVLALLEGKLKSNLYSDQLAAVAFLINNWRCGLFDVMGLGKTVEALAAVVALDIPKTLVICPFTVVPGFAREIEKHTHLRPLVIPRGKKTAVKFLQESKDWDVLLTHPENLIGNKQSFAGDLTKALKKIPWGMFLIDEAHYYKNVDAKRTQCVASLLSESRDPEGQIPRAVFMTGTPVSENPTSAYVALRLLSRDFVCHPVKFENYFCVKVKTKFGQKITGFKNLNELKVLVENISIRRTKDDVTGFPDQSIIVRDIFLGGRQLKLYRAMCGDIAQDISSSSVINLMRLLENARVLRLRQLMNHPSLLEEAGESAKYEELDSILEEVLSDPDAKVVLWTEWRKSVNLLYDRYDKTYGAAKIYGGVDNQELTEIQQKFENDAKPRVIVAIPAKAGTGLDFLARARTAIYVDRPRSYVLYNQSKDRICRRIPPTQNMSKLDRIRSQPATLVFLDVANSIDAMIREEMHRKLSFVDAVTIADEKLIELGRTDLLRYLK